MTKGVFVSLLWTSGCVVWVSPRVCVRPPLSSIVYLEVDNRQCFQQSSECFQSTADVAAFLGALASSGKLNMPYVIEAVHSESTHTHTHTRG